jgi:hypothetical protein
MPKDGTKAVNMDLECSLLMYVYAVKCFISLELYA